MGNKNTCCCYKKDHQHHTCIDSLPETLLHPQYSQKSLSSSLEIAKMSLPNFETQINSSFCISPTNSKLAKARQLTSIESTSLNQASFLHQFQLSQVDLFDIENRNFKSTPIYKLEDGSLYKGEVSTEGKKHGFGLEIHLNGTKYLGIFKDNVKDGDGRMITEKGDLLQGTFKSFSVTGFSSYKTVIDGFGKQVWMNGVTFEGDFYLGVKYGKGKLVMKDSCYQGDFKDDHINGFGKMTWLDGRVYEGWWKNGFMDGDGSFLWPDGKIYVGKYKEGKKWGFGCLKWSDGKKYEGMWRDGKRHGEGVYTFYDRKDQVLKSVSTKWRNGHSVRNSSENHKVFYIKK